MRALPLLVAFTMSLAACATGPNDAVTSDGRNLGELKWRDAPVETGMISFTGENPVAKRQSARLGDRLFEHVDLKNNAAIRYNKLMGDNTLSGQTSQDDLLMADVAQAKVRLGVVADKTQVKRGEYFSYVTAESEKYSCFFAHGVFGRKMNAYAMVNSAGDREMVANICFAKPVASSDLAERTMLGLLARARFGE